MPADITLDKYVQSKLNRGRQFFYFRVAPKDQKEFRRALPHPFDDGYRTAYNTAHAECFGNVPLDLSDPHGWDALITEPGSLAPTKNWERTARACANRQAHCCLIHLAMFVCPAKSNPCTCKRSMTSYQHGQRQRTGAWMICQKYLRGVGCADSTTSTRVLESSASTAQPGTNLGQCGHWKR